MQRHGEYAQFGDPYPYTSPPASPLPSPFAPLPTQHSPRPSPSLASPGTATPSYGYLDAGYPSYGQPAPPSEADERATAESKGAVHDHRYPPEQGTGRFRHWLDTYKSRNQIIFLALIAAQAVAVLAMIALVYGTVRANTGDLSTADLLGSDPQLESFATYLGLFILAVIFEIGITLDAMQKKNIMTLFVLCLFQFAMLVYSSVLPGQLEDALTGSNADTPHVQRLTRTFSIVIPAVVGFCSLCMTGMLWPLYHEFGWNVFKRIGADIAIRRMYLRYQVFVCLLKFDAFFLVGFSVQFLILVSGTPTAEFVLTIIALPVTLIALVLFAVIVRAESRPGVYISFAIQALGMAYFAYKISRIFNPASSERYRSARATLTIFSVIAIVMLLATFVLMGLCMLNFGLGLKERIPGYAFTPSSLLPSRRRAQRPHPHAQAQAHLPSPSLGASTASHAPLAYANSHSPDPSAGGGRPPFAHAPSSGVGMGERTKTRMSMD
ncbi:hypothetical protein JCM10450v2_001939 [Rhodotorula kratochvilovae]